MNDNKLV